MPLVTAGIFRFTSNGTYIYAFLLFWAIAIGFNSTAALTVAAFSHAYIWVHFYTTEQPDLFHQFHSDCYLENMTGIFMGYLALTIKVSYIDILSTHDSTVVIRFVLK